MSAVLWIQIVVLAVCVGAVCSILFHFPYPSPLIKPFLSPTLRWPERQVRKWIADKRIDRGFLTFFSRDPERAIPPGDDPVAPADGVINDIFERAGMTYVVIALSFWDVHVQRTPVAGRIAEVRRSGDTFMDFEWQDAAFLRNKPRPVQAIITVEAEQGGLVEVRLITSYAARRINVRVAVGESVAKGERIGNITFGSTVTVAIPAAWPVRVKLHQRVTAGESIVASPAVVPQSAVQA